MTMSSSYGSILNGTIDCHVHAAPEFLPRRQHFVDVARDARNAGMRAIVLKPITSFPTMDKAKIAETLVPGIKVFGGVILDRAVGGLNPRAVEVAIRLGAKVIWMPQLDSMNNIRKSASLSQYAALRKEAHTTEAGGITILTANGELKEEVETILNLIAEAKDVVLDTAHLSPEESLVLVDSAKKIGIDSVVIDHPFTKIIGATLDQMKEMAGKGAYLNHAFTYCLPYSFEIDPKDLLKTIRSVGVEHSMLSSDSGHPGFPDPVQCFRECVETMTALGLSQNEINTLVRENPAKVLHLPRETA